MVIICPRQTISAAEAQKVAKLTVTTLNRIQSSEQFKLFWKLVVQRSSTFDVSEPALPRKRRAPSRYETSTGDSYFPSEVEDHFRQIYFEILDLAISCIQTRFAQLGFRTYQMTESLLMKAVQGESYSEDLASVTSFYGDDFSPSTLQVQLQTLTTQFESKGSVTLPDIVMHLKLFTGTELSIYSEVVTLLKLILVNPATNSTSERTFSAMRRIKTYLRSTMGQARLNGSMVLHVHKEKTAQISLLKIANAFVNSEYRKSVFGTFSTADM